MSIVDVISLTLMHSLVFSYSVFGEGLPIGAFVIILVVLAFVVKHLVYIEFLPNLIYSYARPYNDLACRSDSDNGVFLPNSTAVISANTSSRSSADLGATDSS